MKIAVKSFAFTDPNAGMGVAVFFMYYRSYVAGAAPFVYDDPHIPIPAVEGQSEYVVQLPGGIPLTEGQWELGLCGADAEGNISDIIVISRFFDFTAPLAPTNLRIL